MKRVVDLLIVTAVEEEYQAVLRVDTGAVPGSAWETVDAPSQLEVQARKFQTAGGGVLRVAVTRGLDKGGEHAILAALPLLTTWEVGCLSMCGVCAGRRGKVNLGDVIAANHLWRYDVGKTEVETVDGRAVERFKATTITYNLEAKWVQLLERFTPPEAETWLKTRPRSIEAQIEWVLDALLRGESLEGHAERSTRCANWASVITQLWKDGRLVDGQLVLTATGRADATKRRVLNPDGLPEPEKFEVRVGPIGTGNNVVRDPEIFNKLSTRMSEVLGLEMEAAALGALGHVVNHTRVLVMKAVMDFADTAKNDQFKAFAATASAEVLIAFARQNVAPKGSGEDPILDPGTSDLPKAAGPAALLNARHQVVPFHGRKDELSELEKWCESEDKKPRARLLFAPGGMGKTRFAIELCRRLRERSWRAGFLRLGQQLDSLLESDEPALAVIDYAESRAGLRDLLAHVATRTSRKALRVLLLARNHDDWWLDVQQASGAVKDLLCDEQPLRLEQVAVDREVVFQEALMAYLKHHNRQSSVGTTTPNLSDPTYERVLYVHAAALAAAEGRDVNPEALMEETLNHEELFWRKQLEALHMNARVFLPTIRLAVAGLTLKGGGSRSEAETLVGADRDVVVLLRDLYPSHVGKYISGLEPDLLGEAMVLRALTGAGAEGGPFLDRVFDGASGDELRTGFAVLARLSEHHEEARGWIAKLLASDVKGRAMHAFAAAKSVGERTVHSTLGMELAAALEREGTLELAESLAGLLPDPSKTVSLREVGLWVLQKQLTGGHPDRAHLLNTLARWQQLLGKRKEAVASIHEALSLPQPLPEVAMSLNNLGGIQAELGQLESALTAIQSALGCWARLETQLPSRFMAEVAGSLANLGNIQSALGRRDEALAVTRSAVSFYVELVALHPEFLSDLAMSLNNLGNACSELGQYAEAIQHAQSAVAYYRQLAEREPEAFSPDVAMSVSNLAAAQHAAQAHADALVSAELAVSHYRGLAAKRPLVFQADLARSLGNLSAIQGELKLWDAALESAHEAVRLAPPLPGHLARYHHTLGCAQAALGQMADAFASAQLALDAIWPCYLEAPLVFEMEARESISTLRVRFSLLGRAETSEFIERCRTFNATATEPFRLTAEN